jgi:hypothetical protein
MVVRSMRAIGESQRAALAIATLPGVDRLGRYPVALGHLRDRRSAENLHHCVIALLHDAQLHESQFRLLGCDDGRTERTRKNRCYPAFGAEREASSETRV